MAIQKLLLSLYMQFFFFFFFTFTEHLLNRWKGENFVPFLLFPEAVLYLLEWISGLSSHLQMMKTYETSSPGQQPKLEDLWWYMFRSQRLLGKRTQIQVLAVLYTTDPQEKLCLNFGARNKSTGQWWKSKNVLGTTGGKFWPKLVWQP